MGRGVGDGDHTRRIDLATTSPVPTPPHTPTPLGVILPDVNPSPPRITPRRLVRVRVLSTPRLAKYSPRLSYPFIHVFTHSHVPVTGRRTAVWSPVSFVPTSPSTGSRPSTKVVLLESCSCHP